MAHIVLVLGMHRSGTSLVTKALTCLGVELGERAEWNAPDNPKGMYEDVDILAIDELILQRQQRTWDQPVAPVPASTNDPYMARLRDVGTQVVRFRLVNHPLFGLKDPRLCVLLDFWRPVFAELRCAVSIVHAVRHPMAVAKSLLKRNQIPLNHGLDLWLEYNRRARLDADPTWDVCTVLYDAMMALPVQQIERIGAAFDLPVDDVKTRQFSRDFVDETLWHEIEEGDKSLPLEIQTVWQTLRAEAMA